MRLAKDAEDSNYTCTIAQDYRFKCGSGVLGFPTSSVDLPANQKLVLPIHWSKFLKDCAR